MAAADDVEALRAKAAEMRKQADKLSEELGKVAPPPEPVVKAKPSMSVDDIKSALGETSFEEGDATTQTMQLDSLVESGDLQLWKSASDNGGLRTFPVSLRMLEERSAGKVTGETLGLVGDIEVSMDDFKYATLYVTGTCSVLGVAALAFLPENVGATVCYAVAVIPILFLGVGSTAPGLIANAIASSKGTADDQDQRFDRICRHEAGHMLCGYLCGLPVKGYSMSDSGVPCVEFHPTSEGPVTGREFDPEEIAALSTVALSGSVAEILGLGVAKGGENDLMELEGFFRRSKEFIGAQKQQDMTRWGALTAYNLITANSEKFEELVGAFKNKKSVADCVAILESR
eukprot:CAMPEP_0194046622 /NCGR_PEP_ID=MMETSP0009_2-20130614/22003_1 /TAXON_ID=210454 /ORGANISM="Grammatophora oceanica, Strain CCMP 410" /LENGTH=344 /DNA_ID=CAMNT_0038691991 /DNA_START=192 /DNA_END=1226 /DNA_ORIENTATION=+